MARKSKLLSQLGDALKEYEIDNVTELGIDELKEITIVFREVEDLRCDTSYKLLENSIMITFLGILAKCDEWTEIYNFSVIHADWLANFLDLEYGIPSLSTLKRHIAIIEPEELERICVKYIIGKITNLQEMLIRNDEEEENTLEKEYEKKDVKEIDEKSKNEKDIIAYDGKVCCGSSRKNTVNGEIKPVNAMTAFNVTKDIPLATKFIEEKTNEIPTGPELIKMLDLTNTISTFDALNTQEKTIKAIADKGGDYVGALKGNQHNFYKDVVDYFGDREIYEEVYNNCHYVENEKAHNSSEKRTYILTEDINWLDTKKWKNIKSIGLVKREYEENGIKKEDTRYYITSLSCEEMQDFSRSVRGEWGIENNLHWHLDVTFKEDANLTANKQAQANLNILRKFSLNLLKIVKPIYNKSLKLIRFIIGQNFEKEICNILSYLNIDELKKLTEIQ